MYISYTFLLAYVLGIFVAIPIAAKIAVEKVHENDAWLPGKAVYLAMWYSLCSWGFILYELCNLLVWGSYEPIQLIPSKAREAERRLIEMRLHYRDNYSLCQANIESYKYMDELYGEDWQLIPEYQLSTDQLEAQRYNEEMDKFLHDRAFFYV